MLDNKYLHNSHRDELRDVLIQYTNGLINTECNLLTKDIIKVAIENNFDLELRREFSFKYVQRDYLPDDKWLFPSKPIIISFVPTNLSIVIFVSRAKRTTMFSLYYKEGDYPLNLLISTSCPSLFRYLFKIFCVDKVKFRQIYSFMEKKYQDYNFLNDNDIGLYYPIYGEQINKGTDIDIENAKILSMIFANTNYNTINGMLIALGYTQLSAKLNSHYEISEYRARKIIEDDDRLKKIDDLIFKSAASKINIKMMNPNAFPYWVPISLTEKNRCNCLTDSVQAMLKMLREKINDNWSLYSSYNKYVEGKKSDEGKGISNFINIHMANSTVSSYLPYASLLELIWNQCVIDR